MNKNLEVLCNNAVLKINQDSKLSRYIDNTYKIPDVYEGNGKIKLIILGQDPTVKDPKQRSNITTVLNLNKRGSLRGYILEICNSLGIILDKNIYATNLLKNFFVEPPTKLKKSYDKSIILEYSHVWIEVLKEEIKKYPDVPILALGEPILEALVNDGYSKKVRDYWGYTSNWKQGNIGKFNYSKECENKVNRIIIPFPHIPSIGKEFYKNEFQNYCNYILGEDLIK